MGLTLFAELGFGAVELMLGADATVSALVVRDILLKSIFAFFLGWPIYLGLRARAAPGAGRGAGAAGAAGSRRCWEPRGDRVPAFRRPTPGRQPHGAAHRRARRRRRRPLRRALLPALGPAGALRLAVPGRGEEQPHPRVQGDRPARRHPRPRRQRPGRQPHQPGAPAEHPEAARGPGRGTGRADPARPARPHVAAQGAEDDPRTGRSRGGGADDPAPRRRLRPRLLPGREPAALPRRGRAAGLRARLPGRQPRRARPRQRRRGLRRRAEGSRRTRASNRATRSARAGSSTPTTVTCAASRG